MYKLLKYFGKIFLGLFLLINIFIVLSGRFYLYKGIWYTYLQGKTGPTIYDKDIFHSEKIQASKKTYIWKKSDKTYSLDKKDEVFLKKLESKSLLIIRNDSILYEKYWDTHLSNTVSNSFSAAKTLVALLVGCALDEGKIKSLDEPVSKYLNNFSANGKEKITIRHLLMMSSGLDWEESAVNPLSENAKSYYGSDLKNLVLSQKSIQIPGKKWIYQSGNSQLLAYIVEKACNKNLSTYLYEKIWSKIGAENPAYWSTDKKNGDEKAFCCLYATSRDFARVGKLILQKGQWNNNTIISSTYMNEFFSNPNLSTEENIPNYRYGLHIWTYLGNPKVYYCRGILGQYIITIPEKNMIIVRTGMKRLKNIEINKNKYKIGHPKDLFLYLDMANRMLN
ncbi:MAG: serine hydrolase [Flavobacteriia bacterium]|nr:serine hydrolase [Flavobacteriia bacterium]